MPSQEKRWDTIDRQIEYHQRRKAEAFEFFVKIATAVVGGTAWLSQQKETGRHLTRLVVLSDALLIFAALLSAFMIYEHHRAWCAWRLAQHRLSPVKPGGDESVREVGPPNPRSARADQLIASSCVMFAIAFAVFNPLQA